MIQVNLTRARSGMFAEEVGRLHLLSKPLCWTRTEEDGAQDAEHHAER